MLHSKFAKTVLVLIAFGVLGGCGSGRDVETSNQHNAESHEDHIHSHSENDVPHDFVAAVKKIQNLNEAIKNAFAEGDLKKADPPVHEIGHILESMHSLAEQTSLSKTDQKAVDNAVESLFKSFAALDEKIHSGSGSSYSDVEASIKPAIQVLTEKAGLVKE